MRRQWRHDGRFGLPVLLVLLLALTATSCGIPEDDFAERIPASTLPVELVGGPVLPPDESGEAGGSARERFIFMVDENDILVPVERVTFPNPDAIMAALLNNTTPAERELGISSAIPRGTGFNPSNGVAGGIVFIDLTAGSLLGLGREEREVAFAQIVASLDALPAIDAVNFSIDGEFISVQTSDGTTTPGRAVSRRDFSAHLPVQIDFDDPEEAVEIEPTPTAVVDTRSELAVWMFDANGRLIRVSRRIERTPENIMKSVLDGPTIPESETGFTTSLAPDAVVVGLDIDESTRTALVDLTPVSLPPLAGDQKLRAVAQLVYSLTELVEITGVVISIDGVRQAMPTDPGIVAASTILRREDFVSLTPQLTDPELDETLNPDDGTDPGATDPDAIEPDAEAPEAQGEAPSTDGADDIAPEQGPEAPTPTPDP